MAFEMMRKSAVASTYTAPHNRNKHTLTGLTQTSESSMHCQVIPSSSFSTSYTNYNAPVPIAFSTPSQPSSSITSYIEDVTPTMPLTITFAVNSVFAVLPSSSYISFVLSDDDPDCSNSTNKVSLFGPMSVPHLLWRATVWNANNIQVPVNTLLDNRAHLALIKPDFVATLKLPIKKLSKPLSITLALQDSPTVVELYDYVILSLSSLNNAWSSQPVCALIAPGLCSKLVNSQQDCH
jgi:hypothetical protein